MAQGGASLKQVADAAAPLYQSLDDSQKHRFTVLARLEGPHQLSAGRLGHRGPDAKEGDFERGGLGGVHAFEDDGRGAETLERVGNRRAALYVLMELCGERDHDVADEPRLALRRSGDGVDESRPLFLVDERVGARHLLKDEEWCALERLPLVAREIR